MRARVDRPPASPDGHPPVRAELVEALRPREAQLGRPHAESRARWNLDPREVPRPTQAAVGVMSRGSSMTAVAPSGVRTSTTCRARNASRGCSSRSSPPGPTSRQGDQKPPSTRTETRAAPGSESVARLAA